jgi:hypothetical protein
MRQTKIKLNVFVRTVLTITFLVQTGAIAQQQVEHAKLLAENGAATDFYGRSVAISGSYAIIGSNKTEELDEATGTIINDAGSAYIYEKGPDGKWNFKQKIIASNRRRNDSFGTSVAISGNYAVIGAEEKDIEQQNLLNVGTAYVFYRGADGIWHEQQQLLPTNYAANDFFGHSVAIHGNYIVVGAYLSDKDAAGNSVSNAGCFYVFELDNANGWSFKQKVTAADRNTGDAFGWSVAIHGEHILVGAYQDGKNAEGTGSLLNAGSAYLFQRQANGSWIQQQKIVASDRSSGDFFGYSVAISGQNLVVGAYGEDDDLQGGNPKQLAGSAYIFGLASNGTWTQQQKLNAPDRTMDDRFGYAVAIDGSRLLIGAYLEDDNAEGQQYLNAAGSAYLFGELADGTWVFQQKMVTSDRSADAQFGASVAISENHLLMGAPGHANRKGMASIFGPPPVLPIELSDFSAKYNHDAILLKWTTLKEAGNKEFIIKRSINGTDFREIARIAGAGYSNSRKDYVYEDNNLSSGVYYYQLEQVDYDGKHSTHGVRMVKFQIDPATISVYPNPTTGPIYLTLPSTFGKSVKVTIANLSGQLIHSETFQLRDGSVPYQLKLNQPMASGLYLIGIHSETAKQQLKLMVR